MTQSTPVNQSKEQLLDAYRTMRTIREFEERIHIENTTGDIAGFVHLSVGQEAVATGVMAHLTFDDYAASTHRGHGHCIAKGSDVKAMMREIYGREGGLCGGRGGSMHIADLDKGMLGANGIVGAGGPLAIGAALSAKLKGTSHVSVCFLGDGASNQGGVFEAMNMAVVLKLPAVFIFENNGYGEFTAADFAVGSGDIAGRARGFGIPTTLVDGTDYIAIFEAAGNAIEAARQGSGPQGIEARTYRFYGHFEGDPQAYRSKEETDGVRENHDCLVNFRTVIEGGLIEVSELDAIDVQVATLIDECVSEAQAAPFPGEDTVLQDIYGSY
jgi:acetoin:2,6-dichlorophenolindophenol oxidoreductase subunit alpha